MVEVSVPSYSTRTQASSYGVYCLEHSCACEQYIQELCVYTNGEQC